MNFKSIILFLALMISSISLAQGPGGVEAGLRLWLDASDTSTMFTDPSCTPGNEVTTKGQTVQCWKGKSPQAFEAKAAIGAPVWVDDGGLDALEFTSDRLDIEGSTGGAVFDNGTVVSETEVFFVARTRTISAGWAFGYQSGGRRFGTHFPWSNSQVYFDVGVCCGASRINAPWGGSESFLHTWNFVSDDGAPNYQAIYRDGTLVASDGVADSITWGTTDFQIGAYGTQYQQINAAEFIIFDRRLTDPEREQVKNYLLNKWREPVEASDGWVEGTTRTITTPSGTDRMLIVAVGYEENPESPVTNVTYGGQALTEIAQISSGTSFYNGASLWYLNDAGIDAAANTTISVTHLNPGVNHTDVASAVYTGIDQVSPIYDSVFIDDGQSGLPNLETSLNVTEDGLTIVTGQSGNTGTFDTNLTNVVSESGDSTSQVVGVQIEPSDQTARTISINHSNPFRMVLVGAHFRSSTIAEVENFSAVATSDTSINLSWDLKPSVVNYRIAYQVGSTAPGNCQSGTTIDAGQVGSYQLTGLTASTEYSFRVCANSASTYTNGITASATTDTLPPDPPNELLGINLTINDPNSVSFNWVSGGGGTTGFRLAYQAGGTAPADCVTGTQVDLGNTTAYTLSGLSPLTQYSYRVCAYNGTPLYTTGLNGTFTTPGIASPSTNVHLATSWSTGPGRTDFGSAQNRLFILVIGYENGSDIGSISFGGQAMFKITNRNFSGARTEMWALNESQIQALGSPLTANVTYSGGAPVGSIYASVVLGNVDQTLYTFDIADAGVNATTDNLNLSTEVGGLSIFGSTTRRNFAVASFSPGTFTDGVIEANNRLGFGSAYKESSVLGTDSITVNFTLGAAQLSIIGAHAKLATPTPPVNLALASKSDMTLNLTWTSGQGTTTGFRVAYQAGLTAPADCNSGTSADVGDVELYSISGLTSETDYSVRLCSYNAQGTLDAGITLTVQTDKNSLAAPTELSSLNSTVVSSTEIALNWITGGGTTDSFDIAYITGSTAPADCSTGTIVNTGSTAYAFTGLSPSTEYSFRVCAKNADGIHSSGLTTTATTDASAPASTVTVAGGWQTGLTRVADAGSNRALIFVVSSEDTVDADITAVTYGGQSLTHAVTAQNTSGASNYNRVEIWYLLESGIQAAGSTTFDVTFSTGVQNRRYYSHAMLTEIDQSDPINAIANRNFTTGTNPIGDDISSLTGNISIAAVTNSNDGTYSFNNGWSFGSEQSGNSSSLGTGSFVSVSTQNESASASHTNSQRSAMALVNFNVAEPAPNEVASISGSAVNSSTILIDWVSGGGTTTGYRLAYQQGATAPANCFSGTQQSLTNVLTRQISGLSASTQYAVRVCAKNDSDEHTAGITTTVTTNPPDTNWSGAINNNWFDAGNWDNGVPSSTVDCTIPDVANDPILTTGSAACKNITIQAPVAINGTSSIAGFGQIIIEGSATITGTGDLIVDDNNDNIQTLSSTTTIPNLKIEKSSGGNLVLASDIVTNDVDFSGANFNLVINNGIDFDVNNTYSIPANTTLTINQGGRIRVPSGDTILVSGGTLRTTGVIDTSLEDNPGYTTTQAHIGSISGTGNISLQATSGTLDLTGVNIDRLDSSGLQVTGSASISAFDGVHLTNTAIAASGQSVLLNTSGSIPAIGNYFGADYANSANYASTPSYYIIRAPGTCGAGNHTIDMLEWYGNFLQEPARALDNNPTCHVTMDTAASPISLASVDIKEFSDGIVLEWRTTSEINHRGFNLYRSENQSSGFIKINDEMILNSILSTSYSGEYRYIDKGISPGKTYYYLLEDISTTNEQIQHGPYQASTDSLGSSTPTFTDDINEYNGNTDFEESTPVNQNSFLANIAPGVNLYKKPDGNLRLHIIPPEYSQIDSAWNSTYKDLDINSYVKTSEEDKPSLPFTELLIPLESTATNITTLVQSLDDEIKTVLPSPAPGYTVVNGELIPNYEADPAAYSSTELYPAQNYASVSSNSITINGTHYIKIIVHPLLFKGSSTELKVLKELYLDIDYTEAQASVAEGSEHIEFNSLERNGVRIFYTEEGHYRVSYEDLFKAGLDSAFENTEFRSLEVTYRGKSLPIYIDRENEDTFGPGDSIIFFAPYKKNPYTNLDSVLLGINENGEGLRYIPSNQLLEAPSQEIVFKKETHYEQDNTNLFINDRSTGAGIDHFYWSRIFLESGDNSAPAASSFCRNINLSGIQSSDISISLNAAAKSNLSQLSSFNQSTLEVYFSSSPSNIVDLELHGQKNTTGTALYQIDFTPNESEEICFRVKPFTAAIGEYYIFDINSFSVNYDATAVKGEHFKNLEFATNYTIPYESSLGSFLLMQDEPEGDSFIYTNYIKDNSSVTFTTQGIVSDQSKFKVVYLNKLASPAFLTWTQIDGERLDALANTDLLIITNKDLMSEALILAEHKRDIGLEVEVIDHQLILDHYSYGLNTPNAFKEFFARVNNYDSKKLKYVLFAMDATVDSKNLNDLEKSFRSPVYLNDSQFHDYASDLWLIKDSNTVYDFALGRIPSNTKEELSKAVQKIVHFERNISNTFSNNIAFTYVNDKISDFQGSSLEIANSAPLFQKSFTNLSHEVDDKLETILGENFLVNYMGHGSEYSIGELNSEILNISKINSMTNNKTPLVLALNCLSNVYATVDPDDKSLGESLVLKENAGAVGIISANTLLSPLNQKLFAQYFYNELNNASKSTNTNLRIGDILKGTHQRLKLSGLDNNQTDSIILIGDPSLKLPESIFQKVPPFKASKSKSSSGGGGCSISHENKPWTQGLLEFFLSLIALLGIRRFNFRRD